MEEIISYKDIIDSRLRRLLQRDVVVDLGGGRPWETGWLHKRYRRLLEGKVYCLDFDPENKPHIIGDVQDLPFRDESVDSVICNAVLEHIPEPHKAVTEIYRILKPGGEAFVYVPFLYPYHGAPEDYFRFTEKAIVFLFREFREVTIQPGLDGYVGAILSFGVLYHESLRKIITFLLRKPIELILTAALACYFVSQRRNARQEIKKLLHLRNTHGYHFFAVKGG